MFHRVSIGFLADDWTPFSVGNTAAAHIHGSTIQHVKIQGRYIYPTMDAHTYVFAHMQVSDYELKLTLLLYLGRKRLGYTSCIFGWR